MKIASINIRGIKSFTDLTIDNIPETAKLVVLLGPNGSGKSSLFDALNLRFCIPKGTPFNVINHYHIKKGSSKFFILDAKDYIVVKFHDVSYDFFVSNFLDSRKCFYFRSGYRIETDFDTRNISRSRDPLDDDKHPRLMIDADLRVSDNYSRLVSDTINQIWSIGEDSLTKRELRERVIIEIKESMLRVFDDLVFEGMGHPFDDGTFLFTKGNVKHFKYVNLSGGEKAAFDLLLDFILKTRYFDNTIFCIDEPEQHLHTAPQGRLLAELYHKLPDKCQLWIATHSIGMMEQAKELYSSDPSAVVFLDFSGHNFDEPVVMVPANPNRRFWQKTFEVAIGQLAALIAPNHLIFCEGGRSERGARKNQKLMLIVIEKYLIVSFQM